MNITRIGSVSILSNSSAIVGYQLQPLTKELMGIEWVMKFNEWAFNNLPRSPGCYWISSNVMVCHPDAIDAMRKEFDKKNFDYEKFII